MFCLLKLAGRVWALAALTCHPPHAYLPRCSGNKMLKIKIGLVDDHVILRTGLRKFIEESSDLVVVGEAGSGREAIDLVRSQEMDVLMMDISMPGQSGIDALAMIRAKAPDLGILILSGYPEEHYAVSLIRQGPADTLNKQCDPDEIVRAIRRIAEGHRYITPQVADLVRAAAEQTGGRCGARATVGA